MNTYYVQFAIRNIKAEYLKSYFAVLEKELRRLAAVNVKHSFIENGKIYINTYVKESDADMAGKEYLNTLNGLAVSCLNYVADENIDLDITKVELVE